MTSSYRDYEEEAHKLIERLLQSSVERLCREQSNEAANKQSSTQARVEWPKGKSFTVETGLEAIEQLVKVKVVIVRYTYISNALFTSHRVGRLGRVGNTA